jgi:hypothetical protein
MTESIEDSVTYSNQMFDVDQDVVGEISAFTPNLVDSVNIKGEKHPPLLRIRLDDSFGQKFIDAAGSPVYHSDEAFRSFFKGLHISASKSNGGKAIVLFDPYPVNSENITKLTLYYHDAQDTSKSIDFLTYRIGTYIQFANRYVHDYSNATAAPYISNPDTISGDSLIFIQGMAGLNTKLMVPYLNTLGTVFINKAELVITESSEYKSSVFDPPTKLSVFEVNDNGSIGALLVEGNKETDSQGTHYRLNLSRYYQKMVRDTAENAIYIAAGNRWHAPNRFVAGGSSHSKYALKLNLTYATIDE